VPKGNFNEDSVAKDLLSIRQSAKMAAVSYETVARWIRDEKLVAQKIRIKGLREEWRIKKHDLLQFLNATKN
jgi:excisionase family DNA binding protein